MNLQQQLMVFQAEKRLIQTQRGGGWSGEGRVKQSQNNSWRTASLRLSLNIEELAKQKKRTEKGANMPYKQKKGFLRNGTLFPWVTQQLVLDDIFKQKIVHLFFTTQT